MKTKLILPLLSLFVLLISCTREDMSDCFTQNGLRINFSYEQDQLDLPLKRVDIYLFDDAGRFVCSHTDTDNTSPISASKTYTFPLPEGDYTAVAWGNIHDAFTITPATFVEGETTIDEVRLALTKLSATGKVSEQPIVPDAANTELYYSTTQKIHVPADQYSDVTMQLLRNTKEIKLRVLFVTADGTACGLHDHNLISTIRSNDGIFNFENSLQVCPDFYYKSASRTNITGGHDASFRKMRLFINEPSEIIIASTGATDGSGIFYRKSLMELLQARGFRDQQALDQTHSYDIELRFVCKGDDDTNVTVRIFVNGWEYIENVDEV